VNCTAATSSGRSLTMVVHRFSGMLTYSYSKRSRTCCVSAFNLRSRELPSRMGDSRGLVEDQEGIQKVPAESEDPEVVLRGGLGGATINFGA